MSKQKELEARGYRTYENEEIRVFWNPEICQHSGKCSQGNSSVFDPKRRPWIDLSQASAAEIAEVIDQCPSKALQYEFKNKIEIVFEEDHQRSAAYADGVLIGECDLSIAGNTWTIDHTEVHPAHGGRGIAGGMVEKIIEEARLRNVKIRPLCSYAKKMMEGKETYRDVL